MNNVSCLFCDIIAGKIPSKKIDETDSILVIEDIAPKVPIHYLIIPKKHITDIQSLTKSDEQLAADLLFMAKKLSSELPHNGDFKLVINSGKDAGQRIFHLHLHFLSGKKLGEI